MSMIELEEVNCNLCGARDTATLFGGKDRYHDVDGLFQVVQCQKCGLIYLNPRPTREAIRLFYPNDYEPHKLVIEDNEFSLRTFMRRRTLRRKCADIVRLQPKGRLLDVGCATGGFLKEMSGYAGWDVMGVEPNARVAEYVRNELGLEVFVGTVEDAKFASESFDVVTLWNVFEHLFDPSAALLEFARLLKPGGLLAMSLPNPDSPEAKLFGRYWIGFDVPRHLHTFHPDLLSRMLTRSNFEVLERRCFEKCYYTFSLSLWALVKDRFASPSLNEVVWRLLFFPGMRIPFSPFFHVLNRLGKGSIITFYARRDG